MMMAVNGTGGPSGLSDEERLAAYGATLADGIEAALGPWVEASIERLVCAWSGSVASDVRARATAAGRRAVEEVTPKVRSLLERDVNDQHTTPLALVRSAVEFPTEVLRSAGVPPVERDAMAVRVFPDDVYDLSPGAFSDLDPALAEPGLVWGAAKAHVILSRRR